MYADNSILHTLYTVQTNWTSRGHVLPQKNVDSVSKWSR